MKKSLLAFSIGLSVFTLSCQKNSNESKQIQGDPIKSSERSPIDVGGSDDGVTFQCTSCMMTYPDSSNLPKSAAVFSESDVLVAAEPGQATCGIYPQFIKVWYSDEHALSLGVRQVVVKSRTGTTTTNFPITATPKSADIVLNPQIGATDQYGDYSGNDVSVDGGRPLWPCLYITDITHDRSSRSGDWQQGGTAYPPNKIAGTWKSVVRTVDNTRTPALVTITPDTDPAKNNWNLAGGDLPPVMGKTEGYTAEVAWDVNQLMASGVLKQGHIYRLQFMVHDGDQNKVGGDVGESCTTIYIPHGSGN